MSNRLKAFMVLVFTVALASAAYAGTDTASCMTCHGSMQGTIEKAPGVTVNVHIDQEKFQNSVHSFLDCVSCHKSFTLQPHKKPSASVDPLIARLARKISSKSKVDPVAQAACSECHADIYKAYTASVHGKNVMKKKSSDGPVCTSCHGSPHYIQAKSVRESKVHHLNVVKTCGSCHEEEKMAEKYGFSPLVMERYLESFHGRKLALGHSGAPSCSSCHGAHGVKGQKDAASPVVGTNKITTCAKCHSGATEKFVAAITHQPLHPIAHWSEIALIVLTLSVFIFIVIHVLLDIYADIRDRLFRKGSNHE